MTDEPAPRLRMQGIRKRFGATVALDGVDLAAAPGEVLALVGENGAGKSTLMKILSGAYRPDAGEMWLEGLPFRPANPHHARLAGISMIYQELSLAPHLTVAENILLGMEPVRSGFVQRGEMARRAREALEQLGHGDIKPEAPVRELPLAARQLVEIARALAIGCRVLVLDEPTSSLAAEDIERLFALVRRLKQQGHSVIYISHFLEEVKQISDRFLVLRDGRSVGEGDTESVSTGDLIAMMMGREVKDLYPRSARTPGEILLEIRDLAGRTKPAFASLELHRGEVLGIAGLVGAGRTELLRAIFGLEPIIRGGVRIAAYSGPASPARRWEQGAGMVSEDRTREGLAISLPVTDNLTLSKLDGFGPAGFILPARQRAAAARWIDAMQIRCRDTNQPVAQLSGGNQQKVALARLLHHEVDVLLLDEPTRGIDVASKAEIYRLIDDCARQGKAVLMVSSYLPELFGVCDRIAVMCRGQLLPARPVAQVDEQTVMREATGTA